MFVMNYLQFQRQLRSVVKIFKTVTQHERSKYTYQLNNDFNTCCHKIICDRSLIPRQIKNAGSIGVMHMQYDNLFEVNHLCHICTKCITVWFPLYNNIFPNISLCGAFLMIDDRHIILYSLWSTWWQQITLLVPTPLQVN